MSDFSVFMSKNKKQKEIVKYAPSADFVNPDGTKAEWEFKAMPSKSVDQLREDCTSYVGKGKNRQQKFDSRTFNALLIVNSTVFPDLSNAELQKDYGVAGASELLYAMIDNAGEYNDLLAFVSELNGFSFSDEVDEAKN